MNNIFIKTKLDSVINITRIVTVHFFEYSRDFNFPGEKHDFWELVYVDKGTVEIQAADQKFLLSQGEICFHKPNEFHAIRAYQSAPNIIVLSFVCNSAAMRFFAEYRVSVPESLRHLLTDIMREANATFRLQLNQVSLRQLDFLPHPVFGGAQLIKNHLENLLIQLIRARQEPNGVYIFATKQNLQNHIVTSIQTYIDENLDKNLTVSDICSSFHYGKTTLSKVFRAYTGYGIAEYCVHRKIERSKDLLRQSSVNISTISDQLAFDSPQYFSQVFRRVTGMTPSEYRKSVCISEFDTKFSPPKNQ